MMKKPVYRALGALSVALGLVGVFLPIMPTTPFLILAAYFFGREIHKELKVPVGLIESSWGGTRIEPWTPACGFCSRICVQPQPPQARFSALQSMAL